MRERLVADNTSYVGIALANPTPNPVNVGLATANPTFISPASRRLAEVAVLGQDLGDLHRVQSAIGGAVAKAFGREGTRAFLSGRDGAPVEARCFRDVLLLALASIRAIDR